MPSVNIKIPAVEFCMGTAVFDPVDLELDVHYHYIEGDPPRFRSMPEVEPQLDDFTVFAAYLRRSRMIKTSSGEMVLFREHDIWDLLSKEERERVELLSFNTAKEQAHGND